LPKFKDETVRFAVEVSRGLGIFSAKDIGSLQVVWIARNAGHAQRNPSLTVGSAEPAAISPDGIGMIVIRPGDGPQITPQRFPADVEDTVAKPGAGLLLFPSSFSGRAWPGQAPL
jgi:hypothetical protein